MHLSYGSRRIGRAAALLLVLCILPLGSASPLALAQPPAQRAASLASTPQAEACARATSAEWWGASFSSSYTASASDDTNDYSTQQSADVQLTFGMPERTAAEITWTVLQSSGQGAIADDDINRFGDGWTRTRGSGPATTAGWLRLDPAACTYDMELMVTVPATITSPDDSWQTSAQAVSEVQIANRPIVAAPDGAPMLQGIAMAAAPIANPQIEGSGTLPAITDLVPPEDQDSFEANGDAGMTIRAIRYNEGQATAGAATVAWGVKRMGITDVKFRQQQVPSKSWVDVPQEGTVDGNKVRIIARIENPTHNTIPGPLRFIDAETGKLLPAGELPLSLAPGKSAELTYEWDTQGWAWNDGRGAGAHPDRRIRIELGPPDSIYDTVEEPIVVRARPAVLVHGLNSNAGTWASYPAFLQAANRTWKGYAVDTLRTGNDVADQQASNTLVSNALELAKFIEQVRAKEQAWHVDIVAHSMGGLISRQYIHSFMQAAPSADDQPVVRHLAMLGTPNQGSVCALGLATINEFLDIPNLNAPIELTPDVVATFNRQVTNQRGVKFSVIAGNAFPFPCVPLAIALFTPSDLVVTVKSAHHTYGDVGLTSKHHVAMTGDKGIFDLWVAPHLAIGRGGEQAQLAMSAAPAAPANAAPDPAANLQFSQIASQAVPAGGSVDVPIQIAVASSLGVMLLAPPDITATLINPSGVAADTVAAGSERALQPYRVLNADAPPAGAWKLRLENQGQQPAAVRLGVMLSGAALAAVAQFGSPGGDGSVPLTLRATNAGVPVAGAQVTATLIGTDGARSALQLYDDGRHGDGAAGDGVYGAAAGPLAPIGYAAVVTVHAAGETRVTIAALGAGAQLSQAVFLPLVRR